MGNDILPGHQYTDGEFVSGPSLTEHVGEATIKPAFFSSKTAKDPVVLTDEFLIRDTVADQYRKVSLAALQGLMVGPGGVIQTSYAEYLANTNLTAIIPVDDTIPQNTEGTQIVQATISPLYITSRILVRFQGMCSGSVNNLVNTVALFRDAVASALCAVDQHNAGTNFRSIISFEYLDSPSSTSALTYKVRTGPNTAGTIRFNGSSAGRDFGGAARTTLTLQEIK
jgi:hypothetical protein